MMVLLQHFPGLPRKVFVLFFRGIPFRLPLSHSLRNLGRWKYCRWILHYVVLDEHVDFQCHTVHQ